MKEKHGQYIAIQWDYDTDVEYIKGHVTLEAAREALNRWAFTAGDDINAVAHKWARWTPAAAYSDYDMVLTIVDGPARGAFAVTEASYIGIATQAAAPAASTKESA